MPSIVEMFQGILIGLGSLVWLLWSGIWFSQFVLFPGLIAGLVYLLLCRFFKKSFSIAIVTIVFIGSAIFYRWQYTRNFDLFYELAGSIEYGEFDTTQLNDNSGSLLRFTGEKRGKEGKSSNEHLFSILFLNSLNKKTKIHLSNHQSNSSYFSQIHWRDQHREKWSGMVSVNYSLFFGKLEISKTPPQPFYQEYSLKDRNLFLVELTEGNMLLVQSIEPRVTDPKSSDLDILNEFKQAYPSRLDIISLEIKPDIRL